MKHTLMKRFCAFLLSAAVFSTAAAPVPGASAYISKPPKKSRNAAEYYTGSDTYYSTDSQKWIKIKTSLFYIYRAKKNAKYYRPLYYLTGSWLSNNKRDITVHLGQSRSKSVSSIVSSTLGVSSPNVSLATSVSRNYSSTVSSSYSTDYTFVMKNYSTLYYYRPAFFGNILKYAIVRSHRFLKRSQIKYSYTFDRGAGLYLKLARR